MTGFGRFGPQKQDTDPNKTSSSGARPPNMTPPKASKPPVGTPKKLPAPRASTVPSPTPSQVTPPKATESPTPGEPGPPEAAAAARQSAQPGKRKNTGISGPIDFDEADRLQDLVPSLKSKAQEAEKKLSMLEELKSFVESQIKIQQQARQDTRDELGEAKEAFAVEMNNIVGKHGWDAAQEFYNERAKRANMD